MYVYMYVCMYVESERERRERLLKLPRQRNKETK